MKRARLNVPFTMVPHSCFDEYMRELTPNEFQTYLFVMRKTVGWHKRTDEIALSQFKEFINSSIPTIRRAIKGLREKGFVKQVPSGQSYKYTILKPHFKFIYDDEHGYNRERNLQGKVKETFNEPCKNLTTQKKEQKKKLNTTNTARSKFRTEVPDEEVTAVVINWNQMFNKAISDDDQALISLVTEVLCYFTVQELKEAMHNRFNSNFYKDKHYPLLHDPGSFFGWLETIENDYHRSSSKILTFKEKLVLITEKGFDDEKDFRIRRDLIDKQGLPKWELLK